MVRVFIGHRMDAGKPRLPIHARSHTRETHPPVRLLKYCFSRLCWRCGRGRAGCIYGMPRLASADLFDAALCRYIRHPMRCNAGATLNIRAMSAPGGVNTCSCTHRGAAVDSVAECPSCACRKHHLRTTNHARRFHVLDRRPRRGSARRIEKPGASRWNVVPKPWCRFEAPSRLRLRFEGAEPSRPMAPNPGPKRPCQAEIMNDIRL